MCGELLQWGKNILRVFFVYLFLYSYFSSILLSY